MELGIRWSKLPKKIEFDHFGVDPEHPSQILSGPRWRDPQAICGQGQPNLDLRDSPHIEPWVGVDIKNGFKHTVSNWGKGLHEWVFYKIGMVSLAKP